MYTFRQSVVRNNHLLAGYVERLRSSGGEIGKLRIRLSTNNDTRMETEHGYVACEELMLQYVKEETEDLPEEDPLRGFGESFGHVEATRESRLHCDETCKVENVDDTCVKVESGPDTGKNDVKIEIDEDFIDTVRCKNEHVNGNLVESQSNVLPGLYKRFLSIVTN